MENHPIPQDVTGFKFKLIGSVTLKQFLYLLAGGILAGVCFILPFSMFIKLPLAAFFGGFGAMLAFIPIDGRPMDVMAKNFLKALPAENQYIYRKRGADVLVGEYFNTQKTIVKKPINETPLQNNSLENKRNLLYGALRKSYKPDASEEATLTNINKYLNEAPHTTTPAMQNVDMPPAHIAAVQIVRPATTSNTVDAIKVLNSLPATFTQESQVAKPVPQIHEADINPVFVPSSTAPLRVVAEQTTTPSSASMRQEQPQAVELADAQVIKVDNPTATKTPNAQREVKKETPAATSSFKGGFPSLPDIPNVVLGIIKDPRGKILPNVLVEIMDKNGIPVRAFKSNALGQFAAATPLPDGEYNVLLEDPRKQHEFEKLTITLEGKIFEPLEIISTDQREKLRRELFDNQGRQAAQA